MSSPHVIVSAVHELDDSPKAFWHDEHVRDIVVNLDDVFQDKWEMCTAEFKSTEALEQFPVKTMYHSSRDENVVEVILSGKYDMQSLSMTGLEDILEEINYHFERDFTLEVYYWYDGVDKPGGV